jgi:hypothetical protein
MTRCYMLCTIDDFFTTTTTTIRLIQAGVYMEKLSIARTGLDWSIMAWQWDTRFCIISLA